MPRTFDLSASDLTDLLDRIEPRNRRAFLLMVDRIRGHLGPDSLTRMVEEGRLAEAELAYRRAAELFARELSSTFTDSGKMVGQMIDSALGIITSFDQFSTRAVASLRSSEMSLVTGLVADQRRTLRSVVENGIATGTNPREMARDLRDSIGLTPRGAAAVANYRDGLERAHNARSMDTDVLARELRDRRFDPTVQRAIRDGEPLTPGQIDKMVERYAARSLQLRAETIARTESLRAIHEGANEMFKQAFAAGDLDAKSVTRYWNTADDERVRPAHLVMDLQERAVNEPFTDGDGNSLDFPGDPKAPPGTTINCRCVVSMRVSITSLREHAINAAEALAVQPAEEEEVLA